ncbi:immunoglobulin kappa light chain-like [Thunnus albacares]|uniref:immunoglobulin kappa light chain-like n=1 Tax=Thunnus albacares TaxID=8236 RepID=UPI001CF6C907|nr:immunoglobulin kappa light chain-like [Thunnus albacares]
MDVSCMVNLFRLLPLSQVRTAVEKMEPPAEKLLLSLLNVLLLWSVCEAQLSDVFQPVPFQSAALGEAVSITCRIHSSVRTRVWYKLTTSRRLQLVASTDTFYNLTTFGDQFHHYYSVKSDSISSHLSISATKWEDVGTYYCGVINLNKVQFGQGTFLRLKGAKMISDSVVQQPESQSVQPGHSVTLSCSVHTDRCAAEHTHVLWLKNSDYSAPEMIYSSGNKNDTCQSTDTGSGEATCVNNLLMRNLSSDDAGIYYCAVTSCGEVLFGNGTRINVNRDDAKPADLSPTIIALIVSNIILGMVTLLFVWTHCRSWRTDPTALSRSHDGSLEGNQTGGAVIYAAVRSAPRSSSCRPTAVKHSRDSVVYTDVSYCQQQV